MPVVRPESVFWVATFISKRSLTGGISPFAKQRKYLLNKKNKNSQINNQYFMDEYTKMGFIRSARK